jgi:hypothetical protein
LWNWPQEWNRKRSQQGGAVLYDLLKYRPRRFQASLIAGILKKRSSVIRVFTVSYLRREELSTRYCLKTRMYVQQITEEKVWGCKKVRINGKSKEVRWLEIYT